MGCNGGKGDLEWCEASEAQEKCRWFHANVGVHEHVQVQISNHAIPPHKFIDLACIIRMSNITPKENTSTPRRLSSGDQIPMYIVTVFASRSVRLTNQVQLKRPDNDLCN